MKMNVKQTKLVGLTMELDLKTREYHELCKKLESLKAQNIDANDKQFALLLKQFSTNLEEITNIKTQLAELKD